MPLAQPVWLSYLTRRKHDSAVTSSGTVVATRKGGKTLTWAPFDPDIRAVWRTVLHDVSVHPVLEVYGATGRSVFVLTVLKKERSI